MIWENGKSEFHAFHEEFMTEKAKLKGRCFDLVNAYKQCPIQPEDATVAIIAVKNLAIGKAEFFETTVLPSGATAPLQCFNRIANVLDHSLHHLFGIPCSNYFDDFTIVVPEALAEGVEEIILEFVAAFGWTPRKTNAES